MVCFGKNLAILALFLRATFAEDNDSSNICNSPFGVSNAQDAYRVSSCVYFNSTLRISDTSISELDFTGLRGVTGDIYIQRNENLSAIKFDSLEYAGGKIEFINNTVLVAASMHRLQQCNRLGITNNPNLSTLDIQNLKGVGSLSVIQTALPEFSKLPISYINDIEISSNPYLKSVQFPNLNTTLGDLVVANNSPDSICKLPKLVTVKGSATFRDLGDLTLDSLSEVFGTLNLLNNFFSQFSLTNLSTAKKDITIMGNTNLQDFRIDNLQNINGGLKIANNTELSIINENMFASLAYVKGALVIAGPITKISFPLLQRVDGAIQIDSTENLDCSEVKATLGKASKAKWTCKNNVSVEKKGSSNSGSSKANEETSSQTKLFVNLGSLFSVFFLALSFL